MTPSPVSQELMVAATKSPQVETLGDAFAASKKQQQSLTLGDLAQRRSNQELAEGAITLSNAEKAQTEARAIDNTMAKHTAPGPDGRPKIDRDGVINDLTAAGHGSAASRVQAQFDAQDLARAKGIEADNLAKTSTLNLVSARSGELAKLAQAVVDAPPEGKQAAYQNMHQQALHLGLITPEMQGQFPDQYDPSQDPHIKSIILGAQDTKTRSEMATAELTRTKTQADIDKEKAANTETWRVTGANQLSLAANPQQYGAMLADLARRGAPPDVLATYPKVQDWTPATQTMLGRSAMTADERVKADQAAASFEETKSRNAQAKKNEDAMRSQGEQRLAIERDAEATRKVVADPFGALNLNKNPAINGNLHGMEFLAQLPPVVATRIQHIASGADTLSAAEMRGAAGQTLKAYVETYDPSWSEQRAQIRKAFTTGPDGRNIGNLNTAPVHLAQLADASKAMANGSFVPGNQLYNTVATMFGGTAPTNFNAMKTVVAGEMAAAMKGNATDPEIESFNRSVNSANSAQQLAGVIQNVFIPALATKLQTYNERYHKESSVDDPWTPVLPSAKAVFARYGIDPTAAPAAPAAATKNPFR